jgi:hypothetical protein
VRRRVRTTPFALAFDLPSFPKPPPPPQPDPLDQARGELWEGFEFAEPADQLALFRRALAEPDVLDAKLVFEVQVYRHTRRSSD